MSTHGNDVYGGNYPKARKLALARSSGKCQLCGLQPAVEAHHWAWPDYPSGEKVQGHDLTALCKPCHEFATVMRDWVVRKDAQIAHLTDALDQCHTFVAKREAISLWLYPEGDLKYGSNTFHSTYRASKKRAEPRIQYEKSNARKKKEPPLVLIFWIIVVSVFAWFVLIAVLTA